MARRAKEEGYYASASVTLPFPSRYTSLQGSASTTASLPHRNLLHADRTSDEYPISFRQYRQLWPTKMNIKYFQYPVIDRETSVQSLLQLAQRQFDLTWADHASAGSHEVGDKKSDNKLHPSAGVMRFHFITLGGRNSGLISRRRTLLLIRQLSQRPLSLLPRGGALGVLSTFFTHQPAH